MRIKVLACALLLLAVPALAQEKIGDVIPGLAADSAMPDTVQASNDGFQNREYVIYRPDAGFVKLHFSSFSLTPGESVTVRDGNYDAIETFVAGGPGGSGSFWAVSVEGDTAIIEYRSKGGGSFKVDKLAIGTPPRFGIESSCPGSGNDYTGVACASNLSGPGSYLTPDLESSVAHVRFVKNGGVYMCTGSAVSPTGHFLTNEHCFSEHTQAQCDSYEVYFNYESSNCSATSGSKGTALRCSQLVKYNYELDYALFQMDSYPGQHLSLTARALTAGEDLFIIQHPSGYPKKVSEDAVLVPQIDGRGTDTDLSYQADTAGGSSGSPVFDANGEVIGLHHFGGCSSSAGNQGVRMELILPEIASIIGAPSTRTAAIR